ncbi:MAG: binding-protein-dependent transport system inner rane component [Glaciihabitans sp.]|jgi:ABC-type glycerol-3-phosphate transport system permease component|nr:binding-protein-dependent transport system inner rane component [Glaciihabitans sp.]MDQ1571235.1 raffinose/stachyose/melibiose transport system permease protein [Actinomycetota bacterium]
MTDFTETERSQLRLASGLDKPLPREQNRISPRRRFALTGKHLLLILLAGLTLAPVVLIISTALKTDVDVKVDPFGLFTSFSFENIVNAWTQGGFSDYVWNSVLLTVPSTALVLVLSTLAGYAFARLPFPGRTTLFYVVVLGLLVPFFTYMIPLFYQLRSLGLLDTLPGVILVLTSTGVSFGTFFMRAFFTDLPVELDQAARIDGASEWQIFHRIMLPLVGSGISALGVFTFLGAWNNFLVPLLYLPGGNFRPVTTGLYQFMSARLIDVGPLAAAALITIFPVLVLFVVLQKQVATGFISGAVKG